MSFNLASGPRSQFLAWAGVCGAGIAAYITIKRRTAEKKKIDMANKLAAQASGDVRPSGISNKGGVGISTASGAYLAAMRNSSSSSSSSSSSPSSSASISVPSSSSSTPSTLPSFSSSSSSTRTPESNFLSSSTDGINTKTIRSWLSMSPNKSSLADYRKSDPPMSLSEYRAQMEAAVDGKLNEYVD